MKKRVLVFILAACSLAVAQTAKTEATSAPGVNPPKLSAEVKFQVRDLQVKMANLAAQINPAMQAYNDVNNKLQTLTATVCGKGFVFNSDVKTADGNSTEPGCQTAPPKPAEPKK